MIPVLLARPTGASARTEVLACETKTLTNIRVAPLQPSLDIGQPPGPFTTDDEFYARSVSYPQEWVKVVHAGVYVVIPNWQPGERVRVVKTE